MYLPHVSERVHVVEDGNALPAAGRVQDVAVDFEILHHQVHQVGAQLQRHHVGPVGLGPLQRRPRSMLRLQLAPQLAGKEVELLEEWGSEGGKCTRVCMEDCEGIKEKQGVCAPWWKQRKTQK